MAMYVTSHFSAPSLAMMHGVLAAPFLGTIIVANPGIRVSHMPVMLHPSEGDLGTLYSHIPINDPIREGIEAGANCVIVFNGPMAYISPAWYVDPYLPTYNHIVIHAEGAPTTIEDKSSILALLAELVQLHEREFEHEWALMRDADPELVQKFLRGLLMFRMPIRRLEGKFKVSQNRSPEDRRGIIRGLRERGLPSCSAMASFMESYPYSEP